MAPPKEAAGAAEAPSQDLKDVEQSTEPETVDSSAAPETHEEGENETTEAVAEEETDTKSSSDDSSAGVPYEAVVDTEGVDIPGEAPADVERHAVLDGLPATTPGAA